MPENIHYTDFADNIREYYPNFKEGNNDFELVQNFLAKYPQYRGGISFDVKPSKGKGKTTPTQAPSNRIDLFQGAQDVPPYLQQIGTGISRSAQQVPKFTDTRIDAALQYSNKFARKKGEPEITRENITPQNILDYTTYNIKKSVAGSEGPSTRINAVTAANDIYFGNLSKMASEKYGIDLDELINSEDPIEQDYVQAADMSSQLKLLAEQYRNAGDMATYKDFTQQAGLLDEYTGELSKDPNLSRRISAKAEFFPKIEGMAKDSKLKVDAIRTEATVKKLASDAMDYGFVPTKFAKEIARDYIGGTMYWVADLFGSDKVKNFVLNSPILSKDPLYQDEQFMSPKEPGKDIQWDRVPGFVYKQTLNMIPAIAGGMALGPAAGTALANVAGVARGTAAAANIVRGTTIGARMLGTALTTYDDAIYELDQAASKSGTYISPSQKSMLASAATIKTAAIESLNPLDRAFKGGLVKNFAESAVKALSTGRGFRYAMINGANALIQAAKVGGLEIGEELLDETVQRGINSYSNEVLGFEGTPGALDEEIPTAEEYADITINTLIATTPFMGAGAISASSNFRNDAFHSVSRQGLADKFLLKMEENIDQIGAKKFKVISNELQKVNNAYKGIPKEYDEDAARAIADKSIQIEELKDQLNGAPSQVIKDKIKAKIQSLENEILEIDATQEQAVAKGEQPPVYSPGQTTLAASDQEDENVLRIVSERVEPLFQPLVQRMTNAEEIDMNEIESVAEQMIDEQSRILESETLSETEKSALSQLIESQIDNLLDYEFATITTTEQTGQGIEVKGVVRAAKPGLPQKVSAERFHGATVTDPKTGEKRIVVLRKVPITQSRSGLVYQIAPKSFSGKLLSSPENQQVVSEEEAKSTPFSNMEYVSSVFDDAGKFMGVILRDAKTGEEIQLDNSFQPGSKSTQGETMGWNELALDIAIAESQKQIGTVPEGAFISTIQRVVPLEQVKKIFPNLRETGTTPAAVGVEPQTEQDVRQETNAPQEGRAQGENAAPVPQEEGRQEGQVAPTAVEQEGETPPATEQKAPTTEEAIKGMAKSAKSAESLAKELEKALNAMKVKIDKGAAREATFMIPALIYNSAIDAAILAVKAGKTVVDAVNVAVKYINENFDGEWDKGGFLEKLSVDLTKPMESYVEYQDKKAKGKQPVVGQKVGVRFNLGVRDYGRKVVSSIHDKSFNGEVIDIVKAATVNDVKFSASKSSAKKIKEGESTKFPMASVDGSFVSNDVDKSVIENGQRVFFDPKITDFFYDKDGREVLSASRATVDGSKYFAEGLKYGDRVVDLTQQQAQPEAQGEVRKRVEEDQEGAPAISESEFERISKKLNKAFKGNVKIVDAETFQKEAEKTTGESIELKSKDGTVYGAVLPNGVIFIDRGKLSANTLLHEHTHLFNQVVMSANPKLWSAIKDAVKQTEEWGKVKNSKAYSNLTTDDQIADEVFSRIVGNAAENGWQKYTNKPIYKKIKDLAQKFYNTILEAFGANVYEGMSAGALADLTLNELLGGISTTPYQIDVKINDLMSQLFKGTKYFNQVRFSLDLNSREKFKNALGERDGRALYDIFGNVQDVQKVVQFARDKFPIKGSLAAMSKLRTDNNGTFGSTVVYSEFQKSLDNELKSSINQAKLDPSDLLKKVGYTLFNPTNLKDARDSFLHYYKEDRHICTLNPYSTRFSDYFVTFIVKDDAAITPMADELTQDNLTEEWKDYLEKKGRKNPDGTYNLRRLDRSFGDPYSTSVVSLQINKSNGSVKEISRYNHQVTGSPDNIFGKDFDRIVENLGDAMFQKFGVNQNASQIKTDLPNGVVQDAEGRFFNYIYEKNGTYYGEGFYTTNGVTTRLNPDNQRMVDGYVINANGKVENIVAYDIDNFFYGSVQKVNYIKGNEISITTKNGDFVFETKNGAVSRLIEFPEEWMRKTLRNNFLDPKYDSNGNIILGSYVGYSPESREKINMWWSDRIISVKSIDLRDSKMQSLGKLKYVIQSIKLGGRVESLGDVVYIGNRLEISDNEKIRSLGKVKYIGYHLSIEFSPNLTDLGDLEYVGGSVTIYSSAIKSLGKLKYVHRNLLASNSSLEDLGDLRYVGGYIELDHTRIRSLGKLKYIGGQRVGNSLSLAGTEVESLGSVEYIDGSINLRNISDLGNLRYIGGIASFNGSSVKSVGKLQYVSDATYGDNNEITQSEIDAIIRSYYDKFPFSTKKITRTIKTYNRGNISYSEEDLTLRVFEAIPFEVRDLSDNLESYYEYDDSSINDIFDGSAENQINKFLSDVDQIISQNTIKEENKDLSEKEQAQPEAKLEKTTAEQRKEGVKSAAQKVAKSFNNWATGGGNKLGIANLPEQDAERFAQLVKDIGVLAEALVENGMTRAETALRAIKPYFETNYSEWLRLANVYFKSEFNLALIQKYPEVYKRGQKLQKEFDKTLKQRDALLAKDIEEAKAEIIGKIKSRLNPSNWTTKTKGKLAKTRLTPESISDLKAYSKLFTDEDLSEMDPKMLKELYKEIDQIYKSGRRSQIANNKVLNEQARNLRQRSVISVGKSLGLTESVSSYEIAKKKAQRPGVRFYIMLNSDPNVIQEVGRKDIDSWKDFFGAKGFTTIAIDVNANTSSKQKGLLGKLRSGINTIAINNFFDTRNIMALLANDEDAFNMFEKNFIDLIYKSDFERDELKNTIGRFDSIAQKLKKSGYDIGEKQKSIVLRLGDNNAEQTSKDGLTIGQIIDVFMMLRDPDALVRAGGEGLVNYNQEDIDKIIDYVLSNKPVLDAVEEVTAKYQDVLQEYVLPTLSTFGYDLEKFNTRTYNTNGSFSKNDVENARAIEILNKVYSNNIPQSVPYSPLSVFSGEEMIGKDYDVTKPESEEKAISVLSNNVISRIGGGQLQFGNVANKYNNYMNGMIDMVTRMPVLHNAQAIFNKDVSRLIENKLGESATKAIKNNINRVVSNRLKVSEEESMINPTMSNWLNRAVLGQMFLNTRSAVFQPIATLNYAAVAPDLEEYVKSTARMLSPINFAETAKEISNQAWVKERFGGKIFSIDAKELDERTKNDQPSYWTVIDQLLRAGYTLTAAGDLASILVGGSPLYDSVKNKKYNEYIKVMSEKDAEAQSIKDASLALYKATNESQQSSNNLLISNSQKNPAIRFFLSFTTANQQLLRRALLAGQMMKLGVGSPQRNAYTILQFGMINAALFTLISRTPELLSGLFDDDEEDLKKKERKDALKNKYVEDVIGGLMSGLGAPGVLLYNSIRGLIPDAVGEEKFDKVTNPEMFYMFSNNLSKSISSSAPAFSIKLRQIEDAIKAAEKGEYAKSLANAISFGSGIPTARAYDLFGQAAEASVRDYTGTERVLRATDIYNKGWAQKHYEEQVLRGKTPALSKIEEKEIKDKNTRELNELMRDLGFRAASKNEAGLKADLEKVKKYSEYAAKNYSLTKDQYETLVENFNRGYFAGTLPKEFVDYGRMSSQTKVEEIAKKINSFENDLERQEYLLKLDSANANQTLFSASEVKRIKELIE